MAFQLMIVKVEKKIFSFIIENYSNKNVEQ